MEREKRLLLVGNFRSGKSSTGNSLIGLPFFQGPTNICETFMGKSQINNQLLWIVNTPGFFSPGSTSQGRAIEIQRYLEFRSFNPHAVLVVCNLNDGAADQQKTINMLKLAFGDQVFKHCIVVVTHSDTVNEESSPLKIIVHKCNGRSTRIENSASDNSFEIPTEDVKRIMTMVDQVSDSGKYMFTPNAERRQTLEECGSDEDLEVCVESLERRLWRRKRNRILLFCGNCVVVLAVSGVGLYCMKKCIVEIAKYISAENRKLMLETKNTIIDILNKKLPNSNDVDPSPSSVDNGNNAVMLGSAGMTMGLITAGVATGNPVLLIGGAMWGIGTLAIKILSDSER